MNDKIRTNKFQVVTLANLVGETETRVYTYTACALTHKEAIVSLVNDGLVQADTERVISVAIEADGVADGSHFVTGFHMPRVDELFGVKASDYIK
jgi:hypothetical protein